ncbi:MAG: hypothetical protein ACYCW6_19830 [Candidatus Xenobia bacterium]
MNRSEQASSAVKGKAEQIDGNGIVDNSVRVAVTSGRGNQVPIGAKEAGLKPKF